MKILNTPHAFAGLAIAALAVTGVGLSATPAEAAATSTWDKLAQCEASGNWHIDTGNGYYGGLQFSMSTWRGYGGSGSPADASKATQIRIAEKVLAGQGWGAWPSCSSRLGLHGTSGATAAAHTVAKPKAHRAAAKHHAHVKVSKKTYRVKSGDTLVKIAQRKHIKGGWHRLADANPALHDPNRIWVGQRLHLPA